MTTELASLGPDTVHVVVDMQRLFDEDTGWRVPTLASIVPPIARLIEHRPDRALYPRFITPSTLEAANGAWQTYYRQWPQVIRHRLPPGIFDLIAPLARHAAP
jgi:nicotinamidase-related amidase